MNKVSDIVSFLLKDGEVICKNIDMSQLNNKTIMITGASGLLGVNFLSSLLYLKEAYGFNFRVIGIINSEQEYWFEELADIGNFEIRRGDLSNINFVRNLPSADCIIHSATYSSPSKFTEEAIKTISLNTTITNELIQKLNKDGKFLFVSTSEIYSGNPNEIYKETDIGMTQTTHPRGCYIEGKRCGESICFAYKKNGIDIKVARLCLAYGIGVKSKDSRALNSFITKGLSGYIKLLDDGSAKRTYLYISDAIEIMWNILLYGTDFIYNIGGESEITIRDLSKEIADKLNAIVEFPTTSDGLSGSPNGVKLDVSKVKTEFNKNNFVSLSDGLDKTIKWMKILKNN